MLSQKLADRGIFQIQLKWPNDVLINGKKICGILVESEILSRKLNYMVIGIGINLNHTLEDFPAEIRSLATSYKIESNHSCDQKKFLSEILCALNDKIHFDLNSEFRAVIQDYQKMMAYFNRRAEIRLSRQTVNGIIRGLDPSGHLIMEQDNQTRLITSGDLWIEKQGDDHDFTH
jgi:BirA family biotin operon repressor/biotin-[acetyl-CoA-carboxylase] ligase